MKSAAMMVLAALLLPAQALACGGVFCDGGPSGSQPQVVQQTGERILFARDDQGRLLAHIQIAYDGPATQFSWILPVVGNPDVSVGTDALFTALDAATAPTVGFQWSYDGCESDSNTSGGIGCGDSLALVSAKGRGYGPPPEVPDPGYRPIGQGSTGPYDYAVLPGTSADAALSWLSQNGYYAPPGSAALLKPYLDGTHNLLALRLTKDADAGDIVPVVVRSDEAQPCVPLQLTAVAAHADMAVLVWILGEARAVPVNYASVEPNLARLDFPRGGTNYDALVGEAVDAAPGGEGFVTEFAGKTPPLAGVLYQPSRDSVDDFRAVDSAVNYVIRLKVRSTWGAGPLMAFLRKWFPEPEELKATVSEEAFYRLDSPLYDDVYARMPFDPQAITDDLDHTLVAPRRDTQALLDRTPYLTRLYTRISPDEMLDDPIFTENHDLPDVTNQLQAVAHVVCEGKPSSESPVRLDLADGHSLWFPSIAATTLPPMGGPAARQVRRTSSAGPGGVIVDNAPTIDAGHTDPRGCGGCSTSAGGVPWIVLTGVLVAQRWLRSRRW